MCVRPVPRPPISNADITVGLGVDKMAFTVQPMVLPIVGRIDIEGYMEPINPEEDENSSSGLFDTTRYQKLIRTQLEIEFCVWNTK